jgi:hypothetical protein
MNGTLPTLGWVTVGRYGAESDLLAFDLPGTGLSAFEPAIESVGHFVDRTSSAWLA